MLEHLRRTIANRRITQAEVALHTGVDQSQISRILKGKNKRESENVQKLCKFAETLIKHQVTQTGDDKEAFELLAAILEGSADTKRYVIELMRNLLDLKRQYENDAGTQA